LTIKQGDEKMTKQTINKYAGECRVCGGHVPAGKGIAKLEWSNQDDDTRWFVYHSDPNTCKAVKEQSALDASKSANIQSGIQIIKRDGKRSGVISDGEVIVYDGRKGYNQVGWLLTRTDNTLYLTSRSNLDGHDMSETYIYSGSTSKIDDLLWVMEI